MMAEGDSLIKSLFLPKVGEISGKSTSDQERSKTILNYLISSLVKPGSIDPVDVESLVTDGAGDGGLDAYVADPNEKKVRLFQCKWFGKPAKISERNSLDLYDFYTNKLSKNDSTNLNEQVRFLVSRANDLWKDWKYELDYVTNGELDSTARNRYEELTGVEFRLLNEERMGQLWFDALSREEPIENEMIVAVRPESFFQTDCNFPKQEGIPEQKIRVLQCRLAADDLVRAYELYRRKLLIRNLRYGLSGAINERLKQTAESDSRTAFYVFHNGISIVCSQFDIIDVSNRKFSAAGEILEAFSDLRPEQAQYIADSIGGWGHTHFIKLLDFQIVNGGQSTITLAQLDKDKLKDIAVPCKISETSNKWIAQRIAIYNNTQNKIDAADLVANSDEQTFLQNYGALEIEPPIFYIRKSAEKWTDLFRVRGSAPPRERSVDYETTYQAFLSWMGNPGPSYNRKASLISGGDAPYYQPISDYPRKDIVLMSGLIANYEKILHRSDAQGKTPEFVDYWTQWAIATLGHIFRYSMDSNQQEKVKSALLSEKGIESWKRMRAELIGLFKKMFLDSNLLPRFKEAQRFFRDDEEEWELGKVTAVRPNDIARYVHPRIRGPSLEAMKGIRLPKDVASLSYYDVYFAIFAAAVDKSLGNDRDFVSRLISTPIPKR